MMKGEVTRENFEEGRSRRRGRGGRKGNEGRQKRGYLREEVTTLNDGRMGNIDDVNEVTIRKLPINVVHVQTIVCR